MWSCSWVAVAFLLSSRRLVCIVSDSDVWVTKVFIGFAELFQRILSGVGCLTRWAGGLSLKYDGDIIGAESGGGGDLLVIDVTDIVSVLDTLREVRERETLNVCQQQQQNDISKSLDEREVELGKNLRNAKAMT